MMNSSIFRLSGQYHDTPECPHFLLRPKWQAPVDIGIANKATLFVCEACGRTFSPAASVKLDWKRAILERMRVLARSSLGAGSQTAGTEQDRCLRINRALTKEIGKVYFVTGSGEQGSESEKESADDEAILPTPLYPGLALWQSSLSGSQQA